MSAFFSVIIPTYNRNELLAQCLERLAPGRQTYQGGYEVIVTDDGSGELSRGMINARFPWARWVEGPKKGPSANRNHGASLADNEWLVFFDDDCLPDHNCLEEYDKAIRSHQGTAVFEGAIYCMGNMDSPLYHSPVNITGGCFWTCNVCISKKCFEQVGGFDESFPFPHMEDIDLYKRLLAVHPVIPFISSARVQHPPRRISSPKRLAQSQESHIYYNKKHGERVITLPRLLLSITHHRLIPVRDRKFSPDSFIAIYEYVLQVIYTFIYYTFTWKKKYSL